MTRNGNCISINYCRKSFYSKGSGILLNNKLINFGNFRIEFERRGQKEARQRTKVEKMGGRRSGSYPQVGF